MHHINRLADHLAAAFGLPVVVEPSRADTAAHLRVLIGAPALVEIWQGDGTDIQYQADYPLTISARLLGGNEALALTHQATALSLRLAEYFRESSPLVGERPEDLPGGLIVAADCIIHQAARNSGEFARLSDDEDSTESRLFLWREDWTAQLRTLVTRPHTPPVAASFTYESADAPDLNIPWR